MYMYYTCTSLLLQCMWCTRYMYMYLKTSMAQTNYFMWNGTSKTYQNVKQYTTCTSQHSFSFFHCLRWLSFFFSFFLHLLNTQYSSLMHASLLYIHVQLQTCTCTHVFFVFSSVVHCTCVYITFFLFIFQTEEHQWMRVSNHLQQCPGNGCSVDMCLYIRQLCEHDMDDCDNGKCPLQDPVIVIKCFSQNYLRSLIIHCNYC